jgi:hypothetical protein
MKNGIEALHLGGCITLRGEEHRFAVLAVSFFANVILSPLLIPKNLIRLKSSVYFVFHQNPMNPGLRSKVQFKVGFAKRFDDLMATTVKRGIAW